MNKVLCFIVYGMRAPPQLKWATNLEAETMALIEGRLFSEKP